MKDKTTPLIDSPPAVVIANRFLVKSSTMDNGVDKPSTMLIISDLVDRNFKIQFFKSPEAAGDFLKLLSAAA